MAGAQETMKLASKNIDTVLRKDINVILPNRVGKKRGANIAPLFKFVEKTTIENQSP